MKRIEITDLHKSIGSKLGSSAWMDITQEMVNAFASNTLDEQYIHTDPDRARTESPYGKTIAHGFLVLSLSSHLCSQVLQIEGVHTSINYGLNRVRFPHATPVGSKIRGHVYLESVDHIPGGIRTGIRLEVEIQDVQKPACVAELVALHYARDSS
ncbi:MAG: MaoC family dehydratase [Saprospiraceae bacterium]|nr:MaoC family dehydratase [Saprospiraceae bacterium]